MLDAAAPAEAPGDGGESSPGSTSIEADWPFRLRIEVEGDRSGAPLALEVRRNGGAWEKLEAHDFPYPTREYDLPLAAGEGREMLAGSPSGLSVRDTNGQAILVANGGTSGLLAAFDLPWPNSPDISIAARFALDRVDDEVALLWGLTDPANHYAARLGAASVSILRIENDRELPVAEARAALPHGTWHEVEIEVEEGTLSVSIDDNEVLTAPVEPLPGRPGIALAPGARARFAALGFEGVARTPRVSIVAATSYGQGDPTGDLLQGSPLPFAPGIGISLAETAPGMGSAASHSEHEWPLVIRRTGDGPTFNEDGDRFEFRMVRASDGSVASPVAAVELDVHEGHLGGTFVETPGRIGPFQASNGDLYVIMEPAETDNLFMMMKSVDGGMSWREVEGANRPATGDLEAVDARLVEDHIVILHQVTHSVRLHTFRTSDHPSAPDSWEMTDEVAARADAVAQMATIAPRSDGSMVAVFLSDRLHYVTRSPEGIWSAPLPLDRGEAVIDTGPQAVTGTDDIVHLAYRTDDGRIWYRRLLPDGTLADRVLLSRDAGSGRPVYGAVLPMVHDEASGEVTIAYRLADGSLWERSAQDSGALSPARRITAEAVVTDAVDSQQAGADLVAVPGGLVALFIDEATRSISSAARTAQG